MNRKRKRTHTLQQTRIHSGTKRPHPAALTKQQQATRWVANVKRLLWVDYKIAARKRAAEYFASLDPRGEPMYKREAPWRVMIFSKDLEEFYSINIRTAQRRLEITRASLGKRKMASVTIEQYCRINNCLDDVDDLRDYCNKKDEEAWAKREEKEAQKKLKKEQQKKLKKRNDAATGKANNSINNRDNDEDDPDDDDDFDDDDDDLDDDDDDDLDDEADDDNENNNDPDDAGGLSDIDADKFLW